MKKKAIVLWSILEFIQYTPSLANQDYSCALTINHDNFTIATPYKVFAANGTEQKLDRLIATISYFSKDEEGFYKFVQNIDYPINLDRQEDTTIDTIQNPKIAALGIALEMVGIDSNLGGNIRSRKRITTLNDLVFDFGSNRAPTAIELVLESKVGDYLKAQVKLKLPDGNEKVYFGTSKMADLHLLDTQHAFITTPLSTATASSSFNIFWENNLNEKGIEEQEKIRTDAAK